MTDAAADERFLVLAPIGRDGPLTCTFLARAGLAGVVCGSLTELCVEARRGAAALVIADEVLTPEGTTAIASLVAEQEPWSDLPVLLFTGEGATIQARSPTIDLLAPLGNVTLLDRPLRPILMVSAARSALRARHRQYGARAELARQTEVLRRRDEFLAMLGHEIRNPLGSIGLAAELLVRRGIGEPLGTRIGRQVAHLARLVDDLLDVSRVTSGKLVLHREHLALDDVLQRAVDAVRPAAAARRIELTVRASGATVDGDPVRLEQVFGNLLGNAVKYTPEDGHVALEADAGPEAVVVSVRDDGAGIEAAMIAEVFEPFVQARRTLDRSDGGLGIGLTLVRALVELHGGTVTADSEGLGRGSVFRVTLPRVEGGAVSVDDPAEPPLPRRLRVLVVEDNPDGRELLRALVETFGHEVAVAEDGPTGVDLALRQAPHMMLVDIGLPHLDGYGVARALRGRGSDAVLVALTGYGQPDDRTRAREAGFDLHLTKPVDPGRLEGLLREVASAGRLRPPDPIGPR